MYGKRNPVLRHFGTDQLEKLGTLQAIQERRSRGEFVPSSEAIVRRSIPEFDDLFEFDTPVPSGLSPNARDLLMEGAISPAPAHRVATSSYSDGSISPGEYRPAPDPSSPVLSVPPGSYDSSPRAAHQATGADSGSGGDGGGGIMSGGSSPEPYTLGADGSPRHSYGGYAYGRDGSGGSGSGSPDFELSPVMSSVRSRGTTPSRRSYDQNSPIQQPPFRSGVPVSGPVRRPEVTVLTGERRRATSSSRDGASRSRSRSASPSDPSQQPSSDGPATSEPSHRPSVYDSTSSGAAAGGGGGGSNSATTTPRRSLGAKISGRSLRTSASGPGGGTPRAGATPRRPPGDVSARGAPARTGGGGGSGVRSSTTGDRSAAPRLPAWAPAAGIANMRLEDMDEATRVALMLNDPGVTRDASREGAAAASAAEPPQLQLPQLQRQQQQQRRPSPGPGEPSLPPSPGAQDSGRPGSPGFGDRSRASEASEQFYGQYRLRKHREAQGVPDFRFSQPRSYGAHAPVQQRYFSFDDAHPALAEQHYARSPAQEKELETERRKLRQERARATQAALRRNYTSPRAVASARQLVADVERLEAVREEGRSRLRELEEEGESLRQVTRQVQRRALDAIARSEQMTASVSRSPSPGASPGVIRSRSRSPARGGYYSPSSAAAYIRAAFGPPPPAPNLYARSPPRASPGRPASASASPSGMDAPVAYVDGMYSARAYYGSPASAATAAEAQDRVGAGYYRSGRQQEQQQHSRSRPVSAPATSHGGGGGGDGNSGGFGAVEGETREVLEILNGVERLPQHAQIPPDGGGGGGAAAAADYLGRARSVATSREDLGLLGPDEQRIAMGVYDRSRYEEYQRQVDLEMQRRAVEGDYDSDLERDEATEMLVEDAEKAAAEEEARRRAEESEREQRDAWMDEYRTRLGPEDGYLPQRRVQSASAGGGSGGGGGGGGRASSSPSSPAAVAVAAQRSLALSDADEELLREPFVPLVSPEFPPLSPGAGYASEGPGGHHPHRRTRRRRLFFKSTVPEPFQFEAREKRRPKPISKVKLEQDLALRHEEEEAARSRRFQAKPVPPAVVEPRYERMLLEAEVKRMSNHEHRLDELASLMERPFSFYYRDKAQQEEREALARAAKDPNRFQVAFRARAVPEDTKEERFRMMMLELEAKREATRRRVEGARQAARERAAQEAQQRREAADRAYRDRLRAVDPALHPYPPKPLGLVPDFNTLHRQFEVHMAQTRANTRKRVTVPQEFALNGSTPEEHAARARKAQERRQRIILDMQMDAELLPEARWPYKSPRGKVRRTPPPPYLVEWMATQSPGNKGASGRKAATAAAAAGGAYQTRREREEVARKASDKLRAEALKRADRLLRAAQARRQEEAAAGGGGGEEFGLASDVGATAAAGLDPSEAAATGRGGAQRRRAAVAGRQDNPEVYVEARHAQVERRVREVLEETLLDQGIEAYRYVEGVASDKKKGAKSGRGAA